MFFLPGWLTADGPACRVAVEPARGRSRGVAAAARLDGPHVPDAQRADRQEPSVLPQRRRQLRQPYHAAGVQRALRELVHVLPEQPGSGLLPQLRSRPGVLPMSWPLSGFYTCRGLSVILVPKCFPLEAMRHVSLTLTS